MSDVRTGQFTRTGSFMPTTRDPVQPRFHIEAVQDELASANAGRPIFRQEERVQHIVPGSPNQFVERVNDSHRQRWPDQYAAFKNGQEMAVSGTPLEQWPILTRPQVLEMKAIGIHTVEQASLMPDTAVQRVGRGGYALRERAKAYLDEADALAFSERLNRENEALNARISAQDRQLAEQRELLDRLHSQLMSMQNQPNVVAGHLPMQHDPMNAIREQAASYEPAAGSSLDNLAPPKRRGIKDERAAILAGQEGRAA